MPGAIARGAHGARGSSALALGLAALLAAATLVTWATSESDSDLFMSLAGGRDVVQGKLGGSDDWSFTTGGRVWINQNWFSHLLIYSSWRWGGESGLLALKAALLAMISGLVFLIALRRGGHWPTAALLSAGIVLACFHFVVLRPNLVTLALVPLTMLLLHQSFDDRRRTWWAVPLMALWSNLHGGFVFGLGMIGLWMGCALAEDWRNHGRAILRRDWQLPACLAACVAACTLSPFGLTNLREPFVAATSPVWKQVPEWLPLLSTNTLAFPWECLVVLGLVPVLGAVRMIGGEPARPGRKPTDRPRRAAFGPVAFDYVLLCAVTVMAFQSRRFVPLAVLASAPPLAGLLGWSARRFRRVVTIVACAGVTTSLGLLGWRNLQPYRPDHPVRRGSTVFDRMHMVSDVFPVSAGRFFIDNGLSGNIVAPWEWEGYLRWVHPDVRVQIGGRAQQVYPLSAVDLWSRIQTTEQVSQLLRDHQVHLVVAPPTLLLSPLLSRLTASRQWVGIYNDGNHLVLADTRSEKTAPLVRRALAGQLTYPSELSGALSLATSHMTGEASPDPAFVLAAIRRANLASPTPQAYEFLAALGGGPAWGDSAVAYLEQEARRLALRPQRGRGSQETRLSRIMIEQVLATRYQAAARSTEARQAVERTDALTRKALAVRAAWP